MELERVPGTGLIVDIGAGGEGLVARLEGERVCAVDIRLDEIREARIHDPPAHWAVCDGRCLCFRDEVFDVATLWFSLGFIRNWDDKERVITEAYRVLRRGGRISIMACRIDQDVDAYFFSMEGTFPDGTLTKVGYGVRGRQNQTLARVRSLLERTGFKVTREEDHGHWFKVLATKE